MASHPEIHPFVSNAPSASARVAADGKFLRLGSERFWVKGVTYGTFAPDANGYQFPLIEQVSADFALMRQAGINTVRTYTLPDRRFLDEAFRHGLKVMVGVPWEQHLAFLDDRHARRRVRGDVAAGIWAISDHPAVFLIALGNEIPPGVVRWHGAQRIERFLRELHDASRSIAPECLFTYVNFPPTEYLDLSFVDVFAFNVYLHDEADLRAYLARLQHIAADRPLLLAEAGADSIREGEDGQAGLVGMQLRAAFHEGSCGAIAFGWTDEWWRSGYPVNNWAFGLVSASRRPKPALNEAKRVFAEAPFPEIERRRWPRVSVVVCAYNAEATIDECLASLSALDYPDFEIIVINDGAKDNTSNIAGWHPGVRIIDLPNGGLSAARNAGLAVGTGDIVAYTDADVRVDRHWLTYLVQPMLTSDAVGAGGPNVVPEDDAWVAQCVARAPGSPTHVMIDDRIAEHVPGCNMAFWRKALLAVGGFNPTYLRAGDDVDLCWRLQARGWKIGFAPAALVWHRHRSSVKAYWQQQVGYGEGLVWLIPNHPEKFAGTNIRWRGHLYSGLPFVRSIFRMKVNSGPWGTAEFPSVYRTDIDRLAYLPHSVAWQLGCLMLVLAGLIFTVVVGAALAPALVATGFVGMGATVYGCLRHAFASDISTLKPIGRRSVWRSRLRYRRLIAWLHFIQPFAQARGRLRGMLASREFGFGGDGTVRGPFSWRELRDRVRSLLTFRRQLRYWSESWTTAEALLTVLAERLRSARLARWVETDDGWAASRDITVELGRWAWLDLRLLVEDHGASRAVVRVARRLRVRTAYTSLVATLIVAVLGVVGPGEVTWPAVALLLLSLIFVARVAGRWLEVITAVNRVLAAVMRDAGLHPLDEPARRVAAIDDIARPGEPREGADRRVQPTFEGRTR